MTESPFSWNSHYTLKGWPCQLTIRADDYEELSRRVNEAVVALEAKGAVPADMIWAVKPKTQGPAASPTPATVSPSPQPAYARRPVGRPPKRPDAYLGPDGVEYCNHFVRNGAQTCDAVGDWKLLPDKKRPGATWTAWSCPAFFEHDDYKAKHPEVAPLPQQKASPAIEQAAIDAFAPEKPF